MERSRAKKKKQNRAPIRGSVLKIVTLLMIIGLNWTGLCAVGETISYFTDTEDVKDSNFQIATLDFSVNSLSGFAPGSLAEGEHSYRTVNVSNEGDLNFQYRISAKSLTGDLCDYVSLEANLDGGAVECANTGLSGFACSPFTFSDPDQWSFNATLSPSTPTTMQGKSCGFKISFEAWQEGGSYGTGGFSDIEEIDSGVSMKNLTGGVVLNEIYAAPRSSGSPTPPNDREWIELYNNGTSIVDVAGWTISEMSGITEKKYTIASTCSSSDEMAPYGGTSTGIGANGRLVLEFCNGANKLNNSGDRVRIYNSGSVLLDDHTYPNTADGKSHVRSVDGIGPWVDPEPTPGEPNRVSMQDLIDAGFDQATIQQIVALLAQRGETLVGEEAKQPVVEQPIVEQPEEPVVEEAPVVEAPVVTGGVVTEETPVEENAIITEEPIIEEVPVAEETPEVAVEETQLPAEEPAQTQDVVENPVETEIVALPLEDSQSVVELTVPTDE